MSAPPNFFANFGNKDAQGQSNTPAAPSPFGAANTGAPSPFASFGTNTAPTNPSPLFGGIPAASTTTTGAPPSLFGGLGAGGSGAPPSIFGLGKPSSAPTTAPTSTTPATSLFGSGAKPNSLFGSAAAPGSTSTAPSTLFGGAGASTTPAGAAPSSNPLFGSAPKPSSLFGGAPTPGGAAAPSSLFGGVSSTPGTAAGSTLFGGPSKPVDATAAPPAEVPKASFSLFGSAPGATRPPDPPKPTFNISTPTAATTPAPTSNLFGQPAGDSGPKLPSLFPTSAPSGGDPAKQPTSIPTPTSDFFKKPADPKPADGTAPAPTTAPAPAPAPSSLFGSFAAPTSKDVPAAAKDEKDAAKDKPAATLPAFGSFTQPKKAEEATASSTTTAAPSATAGAAPTAVPAQPTAAPMAAPPSTLRGKSVEEIVNKWEQDLDVNVQEFNRIAAEVAAWDKVLIENGNFIAQLYNQVLTAETQQQQIDSTLSSIEAQQDELSNALDMYEKQAKDVLEGQSGALKILDSSPADAERDKNYSLATDLTVHLDDLTKSITQMIQAVNELSVSSGAEASSKDDPLTQIAEVLNEHLASLNWIDGAVGEVETRIKDAALRLSNGKDSNTDGSKLKASGYRWNR